MVVPCQRRLGLAALFGFGMASHAQTMEVMQLVIEQERVITSVREAARLNGGSLDQVKHRHRDREAEGQAHESERISPSRRGEE